MRFSKYIWTIAGGVIGSILSLNVFGYLARMKEDFSQVNFAVIPLAFAVADSVLHTIFSMRWKRNKPKMRERCISSIVHGCIGAAWGSFFGYFTQQNLLWYIMMFIIVYAIPYLSTPAAFISVPLFWWMVWNKYMVKYGYGWETEGVWTIPSSMKWIRAPLFIHLLVIPFFALSAYKVYRMRKEITSSWRKKRGKWVGAAIGGLFCLTWTTLPLFIAFFGQYSLLVSLSKIFTIVNFFILPFYVYIGSIVSSVLLAYYYEEICKESFLPFFIMACGGALVGLFINGMANLGPSYTPWVILLCAIVGAIPFPGPLFILGGLILHIYFVIQSWQTLLEYVQSPNIMPVSPCIIQPCIFILMLPSLLAIPLSAYLGYEAGGFVQVKLHKAKLKLIEGRIKNLEKIVVKHEAILAKRNEIEQKINRIVTVDQHNLRLKVTLLTEQAHKYTNDQIQTKIGEIDREILTITSIGRQADEKLNAIENEKEALEHKLRDVNNKLHMLETIDRANIQVKMQKLEAWENATQQELEKIEPIGELETLFKKRLLLGFQIEEKNGEMENARKEVAHLKLTEHTLQLEKLVLELEEIDRKIKGEEPRFFELKDKLSNLKVKRDQIRESLQQQD